MAYNWDRTRTERIMLRLAADEKRLFFEAAWRNQKSPKEVLQDIVEQARVAANATSARVILLDRVDPDYVTAQARAGKQIVLPERVRAEGISMRVMRS